MNFNPAAVSAFSGSKTPEEAARVFKQIVSEGFAELVADGVDAALNAVGPTGNNPAIKGWESLVRGIALDMIWESAGDVMKPLPIFTVQRFAPYPNTGAIKVLGGNVSIGVSVGISF